MKLTLWDPFQNMPLLSDRISRLFEEAFHGVPARLEGRLTPHLWGPPVDIYETDHAIVLEAEVPGWDENELQLEANNGTLTIKGERQKEVDEETERFTRIERLRGSFKRSFNLPSSVDPEAIEARLHNGVLEVTLPKVPEAKQRTIAIKAS